jgi:uncharacterized membrane protein (DUF2068 family)
MISSAETKRPVRVSILALMMLFVAVINGLRLSETIYFWKTLEEYGAYQLYICISGGVWLITGLFLVWGLWRGKSWGRIAAIYGTACYTAWYWLDRLILQEPHSNLSFAMIINIIVLVIIFFILFSHRTNQYFKRDVYER